MDRLMEIKKSGVDDPEWGREITATARSTRTPPEIDESSIPARSPEVETDNQIFVPPFLGSRVVKGVARDDIAAYLNETALFRNQWQYRPEKGENDEQFKGRIRSVLREELDKA